MQDQESDQKKETLINPQSNQLDMIKGQKEVLENVIVKPNLEGKKTIGNLEIHHNGLCYISSKGFRLDLLFSNMKHVFFQPCA